MSLARLLNQPLTIQRRSGTTTDVYGNEISGTTATVATTGYVEQTEATEVVVDRQTYTTTWLVVLPPDVAIDASDRIVHGPRTLEVVGTPQEAWNPRTEFVHHIECRAREVTG